MRPTQPVFFHPPLSPKKTAPTIETSAVPLPDQTAYAMLTGICFKDREKNMRDVKYRVVERVDSGRDGKLGNEAANFMSVVAMISTPIANIRELQLNFLEVEILSLV